VSQKELDRYVIEDGQACFVESGKRIPLANAGLDSFVVLRDPGISDSEEAEINRHKRTQRANHTMATDGSTVWLNNLVVPGADAASFVYYYGGRCDWGRDRNQLYCFYSEGKNRIKVMKSRSPASFGFFEFDKKNDPSFGAMYAFDAEHVYYYGRRVRKAKPQTFLPMAEENYDCRAEGAFLYSAPSRYYYASEGSVYYYGRPIDGLDGRTAFLVCLNNTGSGLMHVLCDKSGFYNRLEPLRENYPRAYELLPQSVLERQQALSRLP
jgi:hypothetical protein